MTTFHPSGANSSLVIMCISLLILLSPFIQNLNSSYRQPQVEEVKPQGTISQTAVDTFDDDIPF
jgi:hypothetical protein